MREEGAYVTAANSAQNYDDDDPGLGRNVFDLVAYIVARRERTRNCTFLILATAIGVAVVIGSVVLLLTIPELNGHIGFSRPSTQVVATFGLSSAAVAAIPIVRRLVRRGPGGQPDQASERGH